MEDIVIRRDFKKITFERLDIRRQNPAGFGFPLDIVSKLSDKIISPF